MNYLSLIPYSLPDGNTQKSFPVPFRYDPSRAGLEVRFDGVAHKDGWSYDETSGAVVFDSAPQDVKELLIRRVTDITEKDVTFNARSILSEKEQNRNTDQLFDALQEAYDMGLYLSDDSFGMLSTLRQTLEMCLVSASNAATSAATAGNIAAQIAFIWTEITGDENLFDKAFATAQELMEAKGAVDAAAAAGIAGVNEASLAALNTAKTEINEAKDSSLDSLDAALGSAEGSLTLKLAEAQGAAKAAEAAQSAAETAGGNAQLSANAAQSAADSAAAKAGEAAGSSSSALAAKQAAEAAKVEALAAQAAAEAAAGEAGSLVNASVTAHNANPQAHPNLMSAHNADAGAHSGTFDPAGTADSAVSAHNSASNPHDGVLLPRTNPVVATGMRISGATPYIDFHFGSAEERTLRLIENEAGTLTVGGGLQINGTLTGGLVGSLVTNGYTQLPNGLIIQWGDIAYTSSSQEITFPITFPTKVAAVTFGCSAGSEPSARYIEEGTLTASGFTYKSGQHSGTYWIAIGY